MEWKAALLVNSKALYSCEQILKKRVVSRFYSADETSSCCCYGPRQKLYDMYVLYSSKQQGEGG